MTKEQVIKVQQDLLRFHTFQDAPGRMRRIRLIGKLKAKLAKERE